MALNVYTSKCAEGAKIHGDNYRMYNVGVCLMLLGIDEVTEGNLAEVEARWNFYCLLNHESAEYRKAMMDTIRDAVGVEINGKRETWLMFSKRIAESFHNETLRKIKDREEEKAKYGDDDELDPAEWEATC